MSRVGDVMKKETRVEEKNGLLSWLMADGRSEGWDCKVR